MSAPSTVVLRMGSLGDLVLASGVTSALAPVTLVTHRRWKALGTLLPGVESVVGWPEDPLPHRPELLVDLQADLRARALVWSMRPKVVRRVERFDWQRRARIWWGADPAPPVVERYARAAGISMPPLPWWRRGAPGDHLVLVPGARWASKRWSDAGWIELGRKWAGSVWVVGGPDDAALIESVARGIGPTTRTLAEQGFERTVEILGTARAMVAGDTGLLHMAGAMGVPLVGVFGPTTAQDGFWCYPGEVVSLDLDCAPCSRHGSDRCPRGHHACMVDLSSEQVWRALGRVVPA